MIDWRAIGYGMVLFPIVLVASLSKEPMLILLTGYPSGLAAGFQAGGVLKGVLYGFVVGCGVSLLFFSGGYYLVVESAGPVANPGIGLTITFIFIIAVILAVESFIGGAIGGLLARLSTS